MIPSIPPLVPRLASVLALIPLLVVLSPSTVVAQTVPSDPVDSQVWLEQGKRQLAKRNFRRAQATFEKADRLAGGSCKECLMNLAFAHLRQQQYEQSAAALERALALDVANGFDALQQLSAVYDRMDAPSRAAEACRLYLTQASDATLRLRAQNDLGYWLVVGRLPGWAKKSRVIFEQLLEATDGRPAVTRINLAEVLFQRGLEDQALELLPALEDPAAWEKFPEMRQLPLSPEIEKRVHKAKWASLGRDIPLDPAPGPAKDLGYSPLTVGGDVTAPIRLESPQPEYTERARRARIQGVVTIQAVIDTEGRVVDARIVQGLFGELDQKALEVVARWRFEPARSNGQPVSVYYNFTMNFRLQ